MKKIITLKDIDELTFTGKQVRELKILIQKELMIIIKRKMVEGHDDFSFDYCIHKEDWNKIWKNLNESKS